MASHSKYFSEPRSFLHAVSPSGSKSFSELMFTQHEGAVIVDPLLDNGPHLALLDVLIKRDGGLSYKYMGSMETVGTYSRGEDHERLHRGLDEDLEPSSCTENLLSWKYSFPELCSYFGSGDSHNLEVIVEGMQTAILNKEIIVDIVQNKRWSPSFGFDKFWVVNEIMFVSQLSVRTTNGSTLAQSTYHIVPGYPGDPSARKILDNTDTVLRCKNSKYPGKFIFAFRALCFFSVPSLWKINLTPQLMLAGALVPYILVAPFLLMASFLLGSQYFRCKFAYKDDDEELKMCWNHIQSRTSKMSSDDLYLYKTFHDQYMWETSHTNEKFPIGKGISQGHSQDVSQGTHIEMHQTFGLSKDVSEGTQLRMHDLQITKAFVEENQLESFVDEPNQSCGSSSSSPNNPFLDALENELKNIDNIFEISSNYEALQSLLCRDGIIIFCCYDASKNYFEFYFKDSVDMASVVGVGLQYAKVILEEGWKVIVREISEMEWMHTLDRVRASSTVVYKSFKLELGLVDREQDMAIYKDFKGFRYLWLLVKFFALKEAITTLTMVSAGSSSTQQENTGGEISKMEVNKTLESIAKLFMSFRDSKGKRPEDDDEENESNKIDPRDPKDGNPTDLNTRVAIELLPGGNVENAEIIIKGENKREKRRFTTRGSDTYLPGAMRKLKVLDKTIHPTMEFRFSRKGDVKRIQCKVGDINFILDKEDKWLHHGLRAIFGLYGTSRRHGEVVRSSVEPLNVQEGKKIERVTRMLGSQEGCNNGQNGESAVRPFGIGGTVTYTEASSVLDIDSRQYDATEERSSDVYIPGGLAIDIKTDPHEREIECRYRTLDMRDYDAIPLTSPLRKEQKVKFQGTFRVLEGPIQQDLVEYKLTASRLLEEVSPELTPGKLSIGGYNVHAGKKESVEVLFNQKYEKKVLLNHAMTHLNGKRHDLYELRSGAETIFVGEGQRTQYPWRTIDGRVTLVEPVWSSLT